MEKITTNDELFKIVEFLGIELDLLEESDFADNYQIFLFSLSSDATTASVLESLALKQFNCNCSGNGNGNGGGNNGGGRSNEEGIRIFLAAMTKAKAKSYFKMSSPDDQFGMSSKDLGAMFGVDERTEKAIFEGLEKLDLFKAE